MVKVRIYSTPVCPWCMKAKEYFKERGIKFDDINVAENAAAAQEMIQKSGQTGVPVIEINGEIIVGFNQAAIEVALRKAQKKEGGGIEEEDDVEETERLPEELEKRRGEGPPPV